MTDDYIIDDGFSDKVMGRIILERKKRLVLISSFSMLGLLAFCAVFLLYSEPLQWSFLLWDKTTIVSLINFIVLVAFVCFLISTELIFDRK